MMQESDKVSKVLLFHDVNLNSRLGMQNLSSRYLMDWKKFQEIFEQESNYNITFEPIDAQPLGDTSKAYVRITIDDGGGSCIDIAKFLKKKNIKGYFFIITKLIGEPNFLSKNEILEIHNMGHIIGSHSHTHPHPFHFISQEKLIYEVKKSIDILEKIIKTSVTIFSVPGGEVNKRVLRILSNPIMGLDEIYISTPYQGKKDFKFANSAQIYGRLCIEAHMQNSKISNFIRGKGWRYALVDYQARRFKREVIYFLKKFLGFKYDTK